MFRKIAVVAIVALLTRTVAALKFSDNNVIVYGTTADCKACAKCYRSDKRTSPMDSACGEVSRCRLIDTYRHTPNLLTDRTMPTKLACYPIDGRLPEVHHMPDAAMRENPTQQGPRPFVLTRVQRAHPSSGQPHSGYCRHQSAFSHPGK